MCHTYGYDISKGHTIKLCRRKAKGHQDEATGDNLMGANIKDKEFSKLKDK